MKILYFDCLSGISGDMSIASLLDLCVDEKILREQLSLINLDEFTLEIKPDARKGISGTSFTVHTHTHHSHDHSHKGDHSHTHHHRHLSHIREIIEKSALSQEVKDLSLEIFLNLAKAEAKVHGTTIDKVHFHEVGAVDSIVDIIGFSICYYQIKPDKVIFSPINTGSGTVKCDHGIMPVPAPATAELLMGIPIYAAHVQKELTTPTGAAIAKTIANEFGEMPCIKVTSSGYGVGKRDNDIANVLRVFLGEDSIKTNDVCLLETNLDDISGEILGDAFSVLLDKGALDVFATPIIMKKNRPAYKLSVLCKVKDKSDIEKEIFRSTTTFGIREIPIKRNELERSYKTVKTEWGNIRIKQGFLREELITSSPEFDDCKVIAEKSGKSLKEIMDLLK